MIKKMLVPYNGEEQADAAFNFALDLAKVYGSELHVLSVIQLPEPPTEVETEAILESSTAHYESLFGCLNKKAQEAGVKISTKVVNGHAQDQILNEAEKGGFDVIVMGHQTRSNLGKWLLGSVTDRVVDHAQCTVIVVKKDHKK
jgi:nucleotide-binding universal stress UspA family protein